MDKNLDLESRLKASIVGIFGLEERQMKAVLNS